jgi:P27 family predicted phage terminase small subunit
VVKVRVYLCIIEGKRVIMKGRKRTSTALKVLKGTNQPSRINQNEMPVIVITKIPHPPKWFSPLARKIYKDCTRTLMASRILSKVDLQLLVAYCHEYSNYLEIMEKFDTDIEEQIVTSITKSGSIKQINPLFKIAMASLDRAKIIGVEFGLTPSSRSKVNILFGNTQDPFQAFLSRRQ